ncbi:hypothetical protein BKA61DRAFT_681673 [Leptodontidium sp. MPI-SDFR-AT-0119]|nr:hypothetical protein BKA61DRAFT_681673 [Leptodontidium sp. MPI-SDFR-AT-0119]
MGFSLKTERDEIVGVILPPPGVIPDFEHPESRGYQIILANAILFPLVTLFVVLRIYTRAIIVRNVGSDDCQDAIILAWVFLVGVLITSILQSNLGLGVHLWDMQLTRFSSIVKMGSIEGVFYGLSFLFVKVSILLLYLRLSPYLTFRIAVWVVMVVTIVYSLLGAFSFLFNCRPIAKNWDITIDGKCIDIPKIFITHASLTIITDIAMLLLPRALVRKLKLPMKQRVALAGLFMTGTLVCIISGIRMKVMVELVKTTDATWVSFEVVFWTILEDCIGIICACLATFKPFFRRHFPGLLGSSDHSDVYRTSFRGTANPAPNAPISSYELEPSKGCRKSSIPQKSREQSCTTNESQEDILGNRFLKDVARTNVEGTTTGTGPLQTGSFISNRSIILPVSPEEI